jgi:hypothetical protein
MSFSKRNSAPLMKIAGLLVLGFFMLLDVQADAPSVDQQVADLAAKQGITPEQLKSMAQHGKELEQEYQMATKSPDGISKLQATLRKAIANIDAASTPVTSDGNKLPASFMDLFYPKTSRVESPTFFMMKPGFMGLKADNLSDQQTLIGLVPTLTNTHPEILLPLLQERADTVPPTAADYLLYGAISEGLQDAPTDNLENKPDEVALPQGIGLLNLSHAKNPIYRLLGVHAAEYVEANQTNRVNFYSAFLNEPDPTVQTSAVTGLAGTKTPATLGALQSLQAAAQRNGNAQGTKAAEEAIQRLNKRNAPPSAKGP